MCDVSSKEYHWLFEERGSGNSKTIQNIEFNTVDEKEHAQLDLNKIDSFYWVAQPIRQAPSHVLRLCHANSQAEKIQPAHTELHIYMDLWLELDNWPIM